MNLHVKVRYLKGFNSQVIKNAVSYHSDDHFVDVAADKFTEDQLDKIYASARADEGKDGARALSQRIVAYRNIRANPTGKKIGKLEALATALKAYIEPSPNKWIFHDESDGHPVPYYVAGVTYEKPDRYRDRACVLMKLVANTRGRKSGSSVSFFISDLGKTVVEILNANGYYLETEAAVVRYREDVEIYRQHSTLTGSQYRCVGIGYPNSVYSYNKETAMERDGIAATVVMDDASEEEDERGDRDNSKSTTSNSFWSKKVERDDEDETEVAVPVHPYVKVFDLGRHEYAIVHSRNIIPYEYDATAAAKLVLSESTKELVTILVQGSSDVMEDIIAGKTGGTIVIATGPPGTGKTLTAEVFAEEIRRPLYVVQCSQLGTDEEKVEKQLQKVLARASRWRAILLIDEADVYVHERGSDIQQNAIVGVFLRVLEHYRGVLFLTSNRSTVIDDAIMSRATAWIRYEYPDKDQLARIWGVLSEQYKMGLGAGLVVKLVEKFPRISGRNVKNLLKLARMLLKKKGTVIDIKLFEYVSGFLDLKTDKGED